MLFYYRPVIEGQDVEYTTSNSVVPAAVIVAAVLVAAVLVVVVLLAAAAVNKLQYCSKTSFFNVILLQTCCRGTGCRICAEGKGFILQIIPPLATQWSLQL